MPEEVYTDNGVITIRSWGCVSEKEIHASKEKIKEIAEETGLNKLLIDAQERTALPGITALYLFVRSIAADPVLRRLRYALVFSEETTEESVFLEDTANNRGIRFKLFRTKEEASNWLKGDV